jgi:hypothetical protein
MSLWDLRACEQYVIDANGGEPIAAPSPEEHDANAERTANL